MVQVAMQAVAAEVAAGAPAAPPMLLRMHLAATAPAGPAAIHQQAGGAPEATLAVAAAAIEAAVATFSISRQALAA